MSIVSCLIVAQSQAQSTDSLPVFRLRVAADEVVLTFHASDVRGAPVSDLKLSELHVLDNGRPPQRVLAFDSMQDFPLHVGILIDTSQSIEGSLPRMRALADRFVRPHFEHKPMLGLC